MTNTPAPEAQPAPLAAPAPAAAGHATGPQLPFAETETPEFAGFTFREVTERPHVPGVFVITRTLGALLYPVYIADSDDIADALQAFSAGHAAFSHEIDGRYYLESRQPYQRSYIAKTLIGKYDPPLNTEHRKGRSLPELAAIIPDRMGLDLPESTSHLATVIDVSEDELRHLVDTFYTMARDDAALGPVIRTRIADWSGHLAVVQAFWSRALRGTSRYTGSPFAPHLDLNLKPTDFDRWLELFKVAARKELNPAAAEHAIAKVEHMSVCFQAGLFLPG